uniref:Nucleotide-binding alpha-beta plait domain-containing protein n=1 Tax=Tanacetum cinerariifolium TaxID=118510 RepID=A0A6L2MDY8_TANCI|nr:nucleotide-binding alpha-beta plait domain-containing protein [Tanacetum cinerariifolium]
MKDHNGSLTGVAVIDFIKKSDIRQALKIAREDLQCVAFRSKNDPRALSQPTAYFTKFGVVENAGFIHSQDGTYTRCCVVRMVSVDSVAAILEKARHFIDKRGTSLFIVNSLKSNFIHYARVFYLLCIHVLSTRVLVKNMADNKKSDLPNISTA